MSRTVLLWVLAIGSVALVFPQRVEAQSLAEIYREAWFREAAERVLERRGMRVRPLAPDHIVSPSDSIRWKIEWRNRLAQSSARVPAVIVTSLTPIRRLERPVYHEQFASIPRSYLGSNEIAPMDTSSTARLRAMLEHAYGSPTRTLPDLYDAEQRRVEEYIQFEYWFLVNDSIPLIVMDVNGPFERGLVLATEARLRPLLPDLKRHFARQLMKVTGRERYADYYYNEGNGTWYVTGFDGERFVLKRIARPNLQHRPWVGTLR